MLLPEPDSPTRPSRSPRSSARLTPWTACSVPPRGEVEPDVQLLELEQSAHTASRPRPTSGRRRKPLAERCETLRRGLSASSIARPIRLQARIIRATATPGRHDRPPGARADRGPLEGVLDHLPERDPARVAEAEEGERRLVEDRDRDRQHRVRDQERRDLRQHVAEDDPQVPGAERPRALDVGALADALDLRADDPRRARPEQDADHDDDVEEARPPDRRDDDHQRHVRDRRGSSR